MRFRFRHPSNALPGGSAAARRLELERCAAGQELEIGIVLLWIAAILTLYTGWDYMKASYDHVGDE